MNNQRANPAGLNPLGLVVKGIAAGIGLASEGIHHRKEKKAARKAAVVQGGQPGFSPSAPPPYGESEPGPGRQQGVQDDDPNQELEEGDEEQWDLDDAQDELLDQEPPNPKNRPFERDPKKITQHFIDDYPLLQGARLQRLSLPVILPQRRPKDRSRGFIRAYAPDLMNSGIDQPMFLDFLETFNKASQSSPWLNAINLASLAFMHLPFVVNQAASVALMLAVKVAKNMQSRHRYNSFLDQINDGFYRPRGLYCMVLTWNPESDDMEVGVNINETIQSNIAPPKGIAHRAKRSLRPSMGKSNGVAFPETSPLVFPALDALAGKNSDEARTQLQKLKSAASFTGEYFDRRAQAKYAGENPDSGLLVAPKASFSSRYSDPNHPSNSGDMLSLITGGKFVMPQRGGIGGGGGLGGLGGRGMGRGVGGMGGFGGRGSGGMNPPEYDPPQRQTNQHDGAQQSPDRQYLNQQHTVDNRSGLQAIGLGGGPLALTAGIKRVLRRHVLYLLIVNMPTEEEMAEATRVLDQAEQQYQQQGP